jgi:hypothetical protein
MGEGAEGESKGEDRAGCGEGKGGDQVGGHLAGFCCSVVDTKQSAPTPGLAHCIHALLPPSLPWALPSLPPSLPASLPLPLPFVHL